MVDKELRGPKVDREGRMETDKQVGEAEGEGSSSTDEQE